jgi:hypothetical protein
MVGASAGAIEARADVRESPAGVDGIGAPPAPGAPRFGQGRGKSIAAAPSASAEGIRRIVDLFGGDVIGPA